MENKKLNFTALTTFDLKKHPFAIDMVNSFDANWPENINLIIYLENSHLLSDQKKSKRLIIKDFHEEIPEYKIFCKKGCDYKWNWKICKNITFESKKK